MGTQTNWGKVKEHLKSDQSTEALRSRFRRLSDPNMNKIVKERHEMYMGRDTIEKRVLAAIKREQPIGVLCKKLFVEENDILLAVAKLQLQGYRGVQTYVKDGVVFVHNSKKVDSVDKNNYPTKAYSNKPITFAVVSDTHIGSICHANEALHEFYDIVEGRGITTVLHAGDISDGYYNNRPTSILEQSSVGFTAQLKEVISTYPEREGVTTYFITGK